MPSGDVDTSWLDQPAQQAPTVIQHWDGLTTITLSKVSTGARLMWVFDEEFPTQLGVFVHLTDEEAQTVYETPPEVGLLERVRDRLRDPLAYAWRKRGHVLGAQPVTIPTEGTEEDFAAMLWDAAENPVAEVVFDRLSGQPVQHRSPRSKKRRAQPPVVSFLERPAATLHSSMPPNALDSVLAAQATTVRELATALGGGK